MYVVKMKLTWILSQTYTIQVSGWYWFQNLSLAHWWKKPGTTWCIKPWKIMGKKNLYFNVLINLCRISSINSIVWKSNYCAKEEHRPSQVTQRVSVSSSNRAAGCVSDLVHRPFLAVSAMIERFLILEFSKWRDFINVLSLFTMHIHDLFIGSLWWAIVRPGFFAVWSCNLLPQFLMGHECAWRGKPTTSNWQGPRANTGTTP